MYLPVFIIDKCLNHFLSEVNWSQVDNSGSIVAMTLTVLHQAGQHQSGDNILSLLQFTFVQRDKFYNLWLIHLTCSSCLQILPNVHFYFASLDLLLLIIIYLLVVCENGRREINCIMRYILRAVDDICNLFWYKSRINWLHYNQGSTQKHFDMVGAKLVILINIFI